MDTYHFQDIPKEIHDLPSIQEQKAYWDKRWKATRTPNRWSMRRGQKIISVVDFNAFHEPRILDIGCGTGWFTKTLSKYGQVTGIDLSQVSITIARENYPDVDYICGNLYEIDFKSESFDIIIAQEVLPHVEDQPKLFSLINRILKRHGLLVLTFLNKFVVNRIERDHGPNSHITNWVSIRDIRRLLPDNFKIIRKTSVVNKSGRGILRVANSTKLKAVIGALGLAGTFETSKEKMGLGLFRVIIAAKLR